MVLKEERVSPSTNWSPILTFLRRFTLLDANEAEAEHLYYERRG
jgi:hypothetical protein